MELVDYFVQWGIPGMLLAGFLAGTVIPFSSEVVLFALLTLGVNSLDLLIAGTAGNWLGGMTTYGIGWMGKTEWLEKYFKVSHQKILDFESRLKVWGAYWALISWLPIIGNLVTASLGFFKTPKYRVAFWMFVGKDARYIAIIYAWQNF